MIDIILRVIDDMFQIAVFEGPHIARNNMRLFDDFNFHVLRQLKLIDDFGPVIVNGAFKDIVRA